MTAETTPILFLPGLLNTGRLFDHQIEHLPERYNCQTGDLTGAETIEELATQVLASAPGRFVLVGLSMGGYVAQEIMRRAPDRVMALVLSCTQARADTDEQLAKRRGLIELAQMGRFRGVTPRLLPLLIAKGRLEDAGVTGPILDMASEVGQGAFIRQQKAIMSRIDSRPSLRHISCPTLLISGREDSLTPPERQAEMAEAIPNSRHVIIEQSGHLPPMEQPQAYTALLSIFLDML